MDIVLFDCNFRKFSSIFTYLVLYIVCIRLCKHSLLWRGISEKNLLLKKRHYILTFELVLLGPDLRCYDMASI